MKIQVIQHSNNSATEREGLHFSPMCAPRALDDYDINLIDLSSDSLWEYQYHNNMGQVDALSDLKTLQQMAENKKNAIVVYVMPQNVKYSYDLQYDTYHNDIPIKDIIAGIIRYSLSFVLPGGSMLVDLAFEKTDTEINNKKYAADFYLLNSSSAVTKSIRSEKSTTIKIADNVFVTTLSITRTATDIKHYVSALFENHERTVAPEWMNDITFGDDLEQQERIKQNDEIILSAQANIKVAEDKLKENAKYKSILYSTGDELVSVVFEILEKLFSCNLSAFEDKKKEDFLIKTECCTFIGEIKGVNSNVKFDNITQIGVHFGRYLDSIAETGVKETVKQLLIINPLRNKPLNQREPIHRDQIDFAIRSGCLIVETSTLLRLFERFCNNELTVQKCKQVFSTKSGLLNLEDFDENA